MKIVLREEKINHDGGEEENLKERERRKGGREKCSHKKGREGNERRKQNV